MSNIPGIRPPKLTTGNVTPLKKLLATWVSVGSIELIALIVAVTLLCTGIQATASDNGLNSGPGSMQASLGCGRVVQALLTGFPVTEDGLAEGRYDLEARASCIEQTRVYSQFALAAAVLAFAAGGIATAVGVRWYRRWLYTVPAGSAHTAEAL